MRVIAGSLSGRQFASPHGHRTRPMGDKVRGALFNVLGDISGLTVLDAFAGSGALSFEAISRGASHATAIDSDKPAQAAIAENIEALGLGGKVKLIKASAGAWLSTSDNTFDLILCDPPYDNLQPDLIARLNQRLNAGGIMVLSLPPKAAVDLPGLEMLSHKNYGDATLTFYRRP